MDLARRPQRRSPAVVGALTKTPKRSARAVIVGSITIVPSCQPKNEKCRPDPLGGAMEGAVSWDSGESP